MGKLREAATNDIMAVEHINWHDANTDKPDADELVLLYCPDLDEPVWPGWHDGKTWVVADGFECSPTWWATMPGGPTF